MDFGFWNWSERKTTKLEVNWAAFLNLNHKKNNKIGFRGYLDMKVEYRCEFSLYANYV